MTTLTCAALYVATDGCYFGLEGVDPWDQVRDARFYRGSNPIVAHPPCERWGRYWHGSPRKPHQYELGDDGGCFAAALRALVLCGGVLEHPAHSRAWDVFDLPKPDHRGGWRLAGGFAVAHVEQAHYGHMARKATWLSHEHSWQETGRRAKHVEGSMFKYGTPVVTYVRCDICDQDGYVKPPSAVVYTWTTE